MAALLDEAFKTLLWAGGIKPFWEHEAEPAFMARPPELLAPASLQLSERNGSLTIVYPDRPLGNSELELFAEISEALEVHTFSEWAAGGKT